MKMFILASVLVTSCSGVKKQNTKYIHTSEVKAVSDIHSAKRQNLKGLLTIEDLNHEFKMRIEVSGLKPNAQHGIHIHEKGFCEGPDYKSAGAHFNPHNKAHGHPGVSNRHLGDLGNIETDKNGVGKKEIILPKTNTDDLSLLIGKSVLINADPDNLTSEPSGNSGDRIACGLIKPVN